MFFMILDSCCFMLRYYVIILLATWGLIFISRKEEYKNIQTEIKIKTVHFYLPSKHCIKINLYFYKARLHAMRNLGRLQGLLSAISQKTSKYLYLQSFSLWSLWSSWTQYRPSELLQRTRQFLAQYIHTNLLHKFRGVCWRWCQFFLLAATSHVTQLNCIRYSLHKYLAVNSIKKSKSNTGGGGEQKEFKGVQSRQYKNIYGGR